VQGADEADCENTKADFNVMRRGKSVSRYLGDSELRGVHLFCLDMGLSLGCRGVSHGPHAQECGAIIKLTGCDLLWRLLPGRFGDQPRAGMRRSRTG